MNQHFQLPFLTFIAIFSIAVTVSQSTFDSTYAEESDPILSDSVGDIHVKSTFEINGDTFVVDNFKVFDQKIGFNGPAHASTLKPTVEVWGAPDYSHMALYEVADVTHVKGQQAITAVDIEFNVLFEIYQGDLIFRTFEYRDCMVTNYVFTTLHDGEETFSGLTQFVYADVFEFECEGYHPDSPLNDRLTEKASTPSSMDWESQQKPTWSEKFR